MNIRLKHSRTGLVKEVPTGFSWITFFFGFLVPLFRGWWGYFFVMFITGAVTFGLAQVVFAFLINKAFINHLLDKGYIPSSNEDSNLLSSLGIIYSSSEAEEQVQNQPIKRRAA